MLMKNMKLWMLAAILVISGNLDVFAQLQRTVAFHEKYTLKQAVVLSRHNIRSPISTKESLLGRITPHEWFEWSSAPSELSLRGGVLETEMGQYFRQWLVSEGLMMENAQPDEAKMRFYANSMQRTIATAQYFSSGMLPVANVRIEHHYPVGTMDPVFNPQLTVVSDTYREQALQQIADLFGEGTMAGIGQKVAAELKLVEEVVDLKDTPAYQEGGITGFSADDVQVKLELNAEPAMTGGLKTATGVADALVLQYYEESDEMKAAFGHSLTRDDWRRISAVKDCYGDVLFTAPLVAVNVAHPLLQEMLAELRQDGRQFTFLCGHDSNIGSVLAALGVEDYQLAEAIESKTPIGCKLVVERWMGNDGVDYVALNLCYQHVDQLRQMPLLSLKNPPMVCSLRFKGLTANVDGLYRLSDFEQLLTTAIAKYDGLLTAVESPKLSPVLPSSSTYLLNGTMTKKSARGLVIEDGRKQINQ